MGHYYNSPEYYAQGFRDYLVRTFVLGHGFREQETIHSGNSVTFAIIGKKAVVKFDLRDNTPYATLEFQVNDGWSSPETRKLRVTRSKAGRVSTRTFDRLVEGFVMPVFKKTQRQALAV